MVKNFEFYRYLTTTYGTGQDIDERIVEGKTKLNENIPVFILSCIIVIHMFILLSH